MKPRISYADLQWETAFAKFRGMQPGTKLISGDLEFQLDWVCDDPHPPSLWLKFRHEKKQHLYIVRRGDKLIHELTPACS